MNKIEKIILSIFLVASLVLNIVVIKMLHDTQDEISDISWDINSMEGDINTIYKNISDIKDNIDDIERSVNYIEYYLE